VRIISVTLFGGQLYLTAIVAYKFSKGTYCVFPLVVVVVPTAMAVTLMTAMTTYPSSFRQRVLSVFFMHMFWSRECIYFSLNVDVSVSECKLSEMQYDLDYPNFY
jgi:hypothetical protein